jgi:hypothetical protein
MVRDDLWLSIGNGSEAVAQYFGNAGVQRASWLAQQRAVGGVLHEGVLEQVGCMGRHTLPKQ